MKTRNAPWLRDELILALDLYLRTHGDPPGQASREVAEVSATLNRLAERLGLTRGERFRNPNGVYMKVMNFRRFDAAYTERGRKGLARGGKLEEEIWREFAGGPQRCHRTAELILDTLDSNESAPPAPEEAEDEDTEAEEGRLLTRLHRARERNAAIVKKKKSTFLREHGRLFCEACKFDFERVYGERGRGFIECHHTQPIRELHPGQKTRLSDLVLLCSNCHRVVHRRRPWLSVGELMGLMNT